MIVAIQVVPIAHAQYVAVSLVKPDPMVLHGLTSAARPTTEDVGDKAKARKTTRRNIIGRRGPSSGHDIVRRRLAPLWGHPKPYGRLERCGRVCFYQIWIVYQIHSNCLACHTIVVVAENGQRKSTVKVTIKEKMTKVLFDRRQKTLGDSLS